MPTRTEPFKQEWTIKKAVCYLAYRLFAQYLPDELRFVGRLSRRFRSVLCKQFFMESAKVISIARRVDFDNGCNIIMRDHSNLGAHAFIAGNYATVTIGRHVMMGKYCIIICQNHKYLEEGYSGVEGRDVLIDDYAWIGHRVTILPGVRIGRHAIVGAGAVVARDVPDYGIAVGNPAVVKKYRREVI